MIVCQIRGKRRHLWDSSETPPSSVGANGGHLAVLSDFGSMRQTRADRSPASSTDLLRMSLGRRTSLCAKARDGDPHPCNADPFLELCGFRPSILPSPKFRSALPGFRDGLAQQGRNPDGGVNAK